MKQFEYNRCIMTDNGDLLITLDNKGMLGWEMISITKIDNHGYEAFFKREIVETN